VAKKKSAKGVKIQSINQWELRASSGTVMQAIKGAGDLIKATGSIDLAIEFLQIWKQGQNDSKEQAT